MHWLGEIRRVLGSSVELSIDFHHRLSVAEAALFCQRVGAASPPFRGRADPGRERGGISPAAEHDSPTVCDRRRVFEQMGIRSIHRAGTAELRAARRLERRWPNRGEKGRRLVRGALYRRHAAQPVGTSDDRGDDPSGGGDPELRPVGVPAPVGRGVPPDLFPVMPALDGDCFPLPTAPGLGVEFNPDAAADYAFERWEAPHWKRREGSYTNW